MLNEILRMLHRDCRVMIRVAALLVCCEPLMAQYDPTGPEPVGKLRGALVLHGGGPVSEEVRETFVELAGGTKAKIAVVVADDGDGQAIEWKVAKPGSMEVVRVALPAGIVQSEMVASLAEATGVWFQNANPSALLAGSGGRDMEAAVRDVIQRGGVVGGTSTGIALSRFVSREDGDDRQGLDLLPGAIVAPQFLEQNSRDRLVQIVTAQPDRVGFGIPEETALILRGRKLGVIGKSEVVVILAASSQRPVRIDRLAAGQEADLVALSRAAQARSRSPFPPADPAPPQVQGGSLVIVGGGGMPSGLVKRFIELAGGPDAPLVVVPCTEQEVVLSDSFVETLRDAGATDVSLLHTKDRRKASSDDDFLAPLKRARGIWFGGGRQWNLVDSYQNTTAHKLMHDVLARGGVIGGSSAGASIQGDYLPRGNPLGNRDIMAEGYEQGLGFLTGVAIDQHFTQRGRFADMSSLIKTYPQLLGIGIDEGTALIVRRHEAEVVGKGNVAFYDARRQDADDDKDYVSVGAGQRFDLRSRRVVEAVRE